MQMVEEVSVRWTTTLELQSIDIANKEIIEDSQKSLPYTDEIDIVLSPHIDQFTHLIFDWENINAKDFPSIKFLQCQQIHVVYFTNGLSVETQSQIINWISKKIPGIRDIAPYWIVDGILQDALMIWIGHWDGTEFELDPDCLSDELRHKKYIQQ
uniref:Uncharacterized protein n=1 Tax=Moniliophthora roreri TaxID=221103 RepID=A0A0W0GEG2_MONRR